MRVVYLVALMAGRKAQRMVEKLAACWVWKTVVRREFLLVDKMEFVSVDHLAELSVALTDGWMVVQMAETMVVQWVDVKVPSMVV